MVLNCLNCNKAVDLPNWRVKQFKYCCRSCWAIHTNKNVPKSAACRAKLSAYASSRTGTKSPQWKGGFTKDSLGYIRNNVALKYEHRRVMENHLGRELLPDEIVHHKDGNKENNRIENLEVMSRADHVKHHMTELLAGRGINEDNQC
jgi:hypothetical protein